MSLYDHPDLYDALLPADESCLNFYVELARRQAGDVLELACGTGAIAVSIAAHGLPVVGIDESLAMLEAARRRAAETGVTIDLHEGDMRTFSLGRRFAFIFVARNSLLHLKDAAEVEAVFRAVREHLAPRGLFAFDVFNPSIQLLARPAGLRFPVMRVHSETLGQVTVEETFDYDAATQVNRITWIISRSNQPASDMPLHLRIIFPQELPLLLRGSGLQMEARFGDFSYAPFESMSPRQVCICRPE